MSRARIALIGLGAISQSVHLPVLQRRHADMELAALVELSPSRLADLGERYGVAPEARFTSLDAFLAAVAAGTTSVDAAIIATGGGHTDEALALIGAGIHVLAEKPLGWSVQDLDSLEAGLRAAGRDPQRWLRIGYMKEHDPAVAAARALLADVSVREVRVEVMHPADGAQLRFARLEPPPDDTDPMALAALTERGQRSITEATGTADDALRKLWSNVVLGSVIHDLALTRHLGLGLSEVFHARREGEEFPGSLFAAGRTTDGAAWNLGWHFIADYPQYRETITIHHERGTVELEFATPYILNAPTICRVRAAEPQLGSRVSEQTWPQEEAFERELEALLALASGQPAEGSSLREARLDLASAQLLWQVCAGFNAETDSGATRQ